MKLMTLKSAEIKNIIAKGLENILTNEGFIYHKGMNEFRCDKGDYVFIFNLLQSSWSDHHSIDARLAISQKKIESILENIIGKQRHRLTFFREIARIFNSPDGREIINGNMAILLFQNEDLEAAVETLQKYYLEIAKPYFKKYDNLKAIDEIINNPPYDYSPAHVGGNFDNRCMKGLIVAKLMNNPRYNKLVDIYNEEIKETMNSESIENYYTVREYLKDNQIN